MQAGLGRPEATCAALIPIKKSAAWWELTQEERRQIFEDKSHHIASSLKYLPAIARQLYHCRDLGEPFDFVTWFEFEPADAEAFEELVTMLRATEEWRYVEREVDIRVERERLDAGNQFSSCRRRLLRDPRLRHKGHGSGSAAAYGCTASGTRIHRSRNFPEAICGRPVTRQL